MLQVCDALKFIKAVLDESLNSSGSCLVASKIPAERLDDFIVLELLGGHDLTSRMLYTSVVWVDCYARSDQQAFDLAAAALARLQGARGRRYENITAHDISIDAGIRAEEDPNGTNGWARYCFAVRVTTLKKNKTIITGNSNN